MFICTIWRICLVICNAFVCQFPQYWQHTTYHKRTDKQPQKKQQMIVKITNHDTNWHRHRHSHSYSQRQYLPTHVATKHAAKQFSHTWNGIVLLASAYAYADNSFRSFSFLLFYCLSLSHLPLADGVIFFDFDFCLLPYILTFVGYACMQIHTVSYVWKGLTTIN